MRARSVSAACALLFCLCAPKSFAQEVAPKLAEYMDALAAQGRFSGAALVAREGKVIFSRAYGMANYELGVPNTTETKFRIGSMTKPFTATAVMLLQERGRLSVQDSICKYVSRCPAAWQPITLRHLLSHTSGLAKQEKAADYLKTAMLPMTVAQLVEGLKNRPPDFKPGERFDYNNNGYVLLGHVIERASGRSYETFMRENLFAPLGMNDTGYDRHEPVIKGRAAGYVREGAALLNAAYIDQSQPFAAGALYSTAGDLLRWDQALYTEKLLPRKTLEEVFTPAAGPYGYGWFVTRQFGRRLLWHGGGTPGFAADLLRFPDDRVTVVILSNLESAPVLRMGNDLAAIVFGEKYELPKERVAVKVDPETLEAYRGDYEDRPGRTTSVLVEGGALLLKLAGQPDPLPLSAESDTRFFHPEQDVQVEFVKDPSGQVTQLILRLNGREFRARKVR
ncbi:MAG: serine hydrolase [Acidobacteriota bacterium]|nr:serine hydrolase [Acidobacteriota bacterium]